MVRIFICVALATTALVPIVSRGEVATAEIYGSVAFEENNSPKDKLIADAGPFEITAEEAVKVYGDMDSDVFETNLTGAGLVHCANVVNRAGDSLYICYGSERKVKGMFDDGRETEQEASEWDAAYYNSGPRLIVEINQPGADDNDMFANTGGAVIVRLVGGEAGKVYDVTVAESPANNRITTREFNGPAVPLNKEIQLTGPHDRADRIGIVAGENLGAFTVKAVASADDLEGSDSGNVVPPPDDDE